MKARSRDGNEFSRPVRRELALRVTHHCSNPDCGAPTSGPQKDGTGSVHIGTASHITAAAPGGARYDASLSEEQRRHIDNAIWLCQTCGTLVDVDEERFPVALLREWKRAAEAAARDGIGKPKLKNDNTRNVRLDRDKAAQELFEMTTRLYHEIYSFIANNFDLAPNDEWWQLRRSLSSFSDAISNYEWLFSPTVTCAARDVHRFYQETFFGIANGNAHRNHYYTDRVSSEGIEIRNASWRKFDEGIVALRTKLADALRADIQL